MAIPSSDMPGHRPLHDRVCEALDTCIESQGTEFKESSPWDTLKYKIVRTALGMANLRDGGVIIIGASERSDTWDLTGISDSDLSTYKVDDIIDAVHKFASPSVSIEIVLVQYRNERDFLAIRVHEFGDTPVVCRRDGPPHSALKQGSVYIRPPGRPRTSEVRTAPEMHDLLELAAEKRARRMIEVSRRIGAAGESIRPFDDELDGL